VLDHIERRRFLVEPTGEDALPLLVWLEHVDLDKGAGELFFFPWRRCLAGTKVHKHVLPSRRLTGVKRHILNYAVALV
jgi:hypothetical protein